MLSFVWAVVIIRRHAAWRQTSLNQSDAAVNQVTGDTTAAKETS